MGRDQSNRLTVLYGPMINVIRDRWEWCPGNVYNKTRRISQKIEKEVARLKDMLEVLSRVPKR